MHQQSSPVAIAQGAVVTVLIASLLKDVDDWVTFQLSDRLLVTADQGVRAQILQYQRLGLCDVMD